MREMCEYRIFDGKAQTAEYELCILATNVFSAMLRVKLCEAKEDYRRPTGDRMTYTKLAQLTGLSRATLESLASRQAYNIRLSTIDKVCVALGGGGGGGGGCEPGDLLELVNEDELCGQEDRQDHRC